jgi:hypothetical protein
MRRRRRAWLRRRRKRGFCRAMKPLFCLSLAVGLVACSDNANHADLAVNDSGDLSVPGGDPNQILGTFSGPCGILLAELHSPLPSLIDDALGFVAGEVYGRDSLSSDGQRLYDIPNAGGSSAESEVMSFEILHYCDGASLLKSETEIGYAPPDTDLGGNSITDILVAIGGDKLGVSVTRAYQPGGFCETQVHDLLVKKLDGINHSSARVLPADRWIKQILHVFVATRDAADSVHRVWPTLDATLRADTIVLVTQTTGGGFIYCDPNPPVGQECP